MNCDTDLVLSELERTVRISFSVQKELFCNCGHVQEGVKFKFKLSGFSVFRLEKDVHILPERKSFLGKKNLTVMTQNPRFVFSSVHASNEELEAKQPCATLCSVALYSCFRSLNYGANPNNDFDVQSTTRWLHYSDFNYWEGTVFFDSIKDLMNKVLSTDYTNVHQILEKHRVENKELNKKHWQGIVRYLSDGAANTPRMPGSFDEGMTLWESKVQVPAFTSSLGRQTNVSASWLIVGNDTVERYKKDSHKNLLFLAESSDAKVLHNFKKSKGRKTVIFTPEIMNTELYTILKHDLDTHSKLVLSGTLRLLSMGASRIELPSEWKQGYASKIKLRCLSSYLVSGACVRSAQS